MVNGKCKIKMKLYFIYLGIFSLLSQIVLLRELVSWLGGDELFYALGLGLWLVLAGLGSIASNKRHRRYLIALYPLLAPILIILLRFSLGKFLLPGQIPGIGFSILVIFLILFIPAGLSGALFYLGTKKWQNSTRAYQWETVGFFIAGLVFTFLFSQTSFPLPNNIDKQTIRWRYPNLEKIIYSKGSQLVVTKENEVKTIFSAGQLIFSSQPIDADYRISQFLSSYVLDRERKSTVLVFGNLHVANAIIENSEIEVNYLSSFKKYFQIINKHIHSLVEPRIGDINQYLNQKSNKFDLIVLDPGRPSNLFNNRYYTKEIFNLVRKSLLNSGKAVLIIDLPTDYLSREATSYGQIIMNTWQKVFPETDVFLVEGRVILLGAFSKISNPEQVSNYLACVLEDHQRLELKEQLTGGKIVNSKRWPLAYFHYHLFWQTMFSFQLPKLFRHLILLVPVSLGVILIDIFRRLDEQKKLGVTMAISGFLLMGLETVLLFLFQVQFGHIYAYLGLIMGTVLLGLAGGSALAANFPVQPQRAVLAYLPIGAFFLLNFWQNLTLIWLILGLLIGFVGGLVFGLANSRWLKESDNQTFIYACDLFGSFLGALLTSTILFPRFGLPILLLIFLGLALIPRLEM
jgi:hypothetical protein